MDFRAFVRNAADQHGEEYIDTEPALDVDQPHACSYCGSSEFEPEQDDNGRVSRATCKACDGTMISHGGTWMPDLIGQPDNHPADNPDPGAAGDEGRGIPIQTEDLDRRTSSLASDGESVLLHRGVGDYSHTEGHRTAEEFWADHQEMRQGFGRWWSPDKDVAKHYSGVDGHTPSGVVVSAHFPAEHVREARGSSGHLVTPGTPGRVDRVEMYYGNGDWKQLPHTPGMRIRSAVDWCRHRHAEHCWIPRHAGTNDVALYIPQDRGACPWITAQQQQINCPVSEPGPMAGMTMRGAMSTTARFGEPTGPLVPVRHAGFKGHVEAYEGHDEEMNEQERHFDGDFDEDLWDEHRPQSHEHERAHYEEHGDYPESFHERHEEAYGKAVSQRQEDTAPVGHHASLINFIHSHGDNHEFWNKHASLVDVDHSKHSVYATQPFVVQKHLDKYLTDRHAPVEHVQTHGPSDSSNKYHGTHHPMMVKHEDNLFAIEGHHRTASDIQAKRPTKAFLYDADKHGFPEPNPDEHPYEVEHHGLSKYARMPIGNCDYEHLTGLQARNHALRHHDDGICVGTEVRRDRAQKTSTRRTAVFGTGTHLSWDEIADRHPHIYGDNDVHGEAADGADGPGIGDAANYLAHSTPDDPDAESHMVHDLHFHEAHVDPKHIDYAPSMGGPSEARTIRAAQGFQRGHDVPPAVLVHRHGVYQVADGHHRAEGAHMIGAKVPAYVAHSPYPDEPDNDGEKGPYNDRPHHGRAEPIEARDPHQKTGSLVDPELRFHMLAAWRDVRAKAKRIRTGGGVAIVSNLGDGLTGHVNGDTGVYETQINYVPGTYKIGFWQCGCAWASFAWGRSPAFRRYEGRMCSHALALQYEAQSRGMFGKEVREDTRRPEWMRDKIRVRHDRDTKEHDLRSAAVHAELDPDGVYPSLGAVELERAPVHVLAQSAYEGSGDPADAMKVYLAVGLPHEAARAFLDGLSPVTAIDHDRHMQVQRVFDKAHDEYQDQHQDDAELAENYHPLHNSDLPEAHRDGWKFKRNAEPAEENLFHGLIEGEPTHVSDPHKAPVPTTSYRHPASLEPLHLDEHGHAWARHQTAEPHQGNPGAFLPTFQRWSGPHSASEVLSVHPTFSQKHSSDGDNQVNWHPHNDRLQRAGLSPEMTHDQVVMHRNQKLREHGWGVVSAKADTNDEPTHARVALKAADTGRILMIQRSHKDPDDPAAGTSATASFRSGQGFVDSSADSTATGSIGFDQRVLDGVAMTVVTSDLPGVVGSHSAAVEHVAAPGVQPEVVQPGAASMQACWPAGAGGISRVARVIDNELGWDLSDTQAPDQSVQVHGAAVVVDPAVSLGADGAGPRVAGLVADAAGDAKDDASGDEPTHAGVALKAADTGRVLMIQRSNSDDRDPAKGTWEWPGGEIEPGDHTSLHGAIREFQEEVGHEFPAGGHVSHVWRSGPYQGHVVVIPEEKMIDFSEGRRTVNPDDPDGDDHEQSAWWEVEHAKKNPAIREECKTSPWKQIEGNAKLALFRRVVADYASHDALEDIGVSWRPKPPTGPEPGQDENPASTGFATSVDPPEWDSASQNAETMSLNNWGSRSMTKEEFAQRVMDHFDALQAEHGVDPNRSPAPGSTTQRSAHQHEGELHDQSEPALPSTTADDEQDVVEDPGERYRSSMNPEIDDAGGFGGEHLGSTGDTVARFQATAAGRALSGDGGAKGEDQMEIAAAARAHLADRGQGGGGGGISRTALKEFNALEQAELINEGGQSARARNFSDLKIEGTHYADIEEALSREQSLDPSGLFD